MARCPTQWPHSLVEPLPDVRLPLTARSIHTTPYDTGQGTMRRVGLGICFAYVMACAPVAAQDPTPSQLAEEEAEEETEE